MTLKRKKKKNISRIISFILKMDCTKFVKRYISSIIYRNWGSYFVFLLLNCIKKSKSKQHSKRLSSQCVMRVSYLPFINFVKIHSRFYTKYPISSKIQKTLLVCSLQVRVELSFFFSTGYFEKRNCKNRLKMFFLYKTILIIKYNIN